MGLLLTRTHGFERLDPISPGGEVLVPPQLAVEKQQKNQHDQPAVADARIASLRILAMSLLKQIETLEEQVTENKVSELNLQQEVHSFEAALIRSALQKTGGRQRRAARLLGVKVTTLNTKIKRYKINLEPPSVSS